MIKIIDYLKVVLQVEENEKKKIHIPVLPYRLCVAMMAYTQKCNELPSHFQHI